MRIDGRTHAARMMSEWSAALGVPFLGALRETQLYVRSLERGLTMFDLPPNQAAADLAQWAPIIEWMKPVLQPPQAANDPLAVTHPSRVGASRPESLMPAQESLVHGSRLMVQPGTRGQPPVHRVPVRTLPRDGGESSPIPRFLKR
jgi:chromosome partitioning protein